MTQDDWSVRLGRRMAGEVRRYRTMRGLSAQQLSDRCAEIGMPIARSVLANFESGRRPTLSVAELLVLAEALKVQPTSLVFPVGYEPTVEVLPGFEDDTFEAAGWWGLVPGWVALTDPQGPFPATEVGEELGIALYHDHQETMREATMQHRKAERHLEQAAKLDKDQDADLRAAHFQLSEAAESQQREAEEALRRIRVQIAKSGMVPPPVADVLTFFREYEAAVGLDTQIDDAGGEA
ncbi:helix-turn-helix transcriptional regulator [Streptomyces sp. NPDC049967]|uniref:helix-turn-helix domain-containing protein n=1 Tax=Streptomyces sp. NPDC049967 TaxID=3155658 RepID=UPI00343CC306